MFGPGLTPSERAGDEEKRRRWRRERERENEPSVGQVRSLLTSAQRRHVWLHVTSRDSQLSWGRWGSTVFHINARFMAETGFKRRRKHRKVQLIYIQCEICELKSPKSDVVRLNRENRAGSADVAEAEPPLRAKPCVKSSDSTRNCVSCPTEGAKSPSRTRTGNEASQKKSGRYILVYFSPAVTT